jgi:hypothetical protein
MIFFIAKYVVKTIIIETIIIIYNNNNNNNDNDNKNYVLQSIEFVSLSFTIRESIQGYSSKFYKPMICLTHLSNP